MSLFAGNLGF